MAAQTPASVDSTVLNGRLQRAREAAATAGVDALVISPGSDLRYLLGVAGHGFERLTCLVIPTQNTDTTLVVPKLEEMAYQELPAASLGLSLASWVDGQDPYALVRDVLGSNPRVALDDAMPALHTLSLRSALGGEQVLAGPVLRELRMRKDAAEIEQLRQAGAAIDRVHARMGEFLQSGRTEREVAADITQAIVDEGHTEATFVIVGSGLNGASPHHAVSDRELQRGDVVVVDIGGPVTSGYFSDCTRTYALGPVSQETRETFAVLQAAQRAAVDSVRPGVSAESVDAAAREPIAAAGLGEYFIHRTGHGIGLDVHEEPYIVAGNTTTLEPGMAFSIEPGIYQPERWGARIEDIVVVTESGCEQLNRRPRDLVEL